MNRKLKFLLAAGLIAVSTFTLAGCNNDSDKAAKQSTQSEQKTEDNKDSKDENNTEDKNSDKEKKDTQKKDENTSKKYTITYYTYDVDTEKLTEHTKDYDEVSVGNVIDALVSEGVLQEGTAVNTAKVEERDGVRTLVTDVNSKFVNFDQGSTQEMLQLQSFADSLIKTFKVKQVLLTVDGKPYSGGHMAFNEGEMLTFK